MEKKGSVKRTNYMKPILPTKTNPLLRGKLHVVRYISLFGTLPTRSHFSSPKTNCFFDPFLNKCESGLINDFCGTVFFDENDHF